MAADDFSTVPTVVTPLPLEDHTVITQSESMKKQYQSLSSTLTQKYRVEFKGITNAVFVTIQAHYAARLGQYDNFLWTSVPSYIDTTLNGTVDGTNMTGRWVTGSLKVTPLGRSKCNVVITFEKDV